MKLTLVIVAGLIGICSAFKVPIFAGKSKRQKRRADQSEIPLGHPHYGADYRAWISIGSNNQCFTVLVDTGSSALWIADKTCGESEYSDTCDSKRHKFDSDASNSYIRFYDRFDISYGDNSSFYGFTGKDKVCLSSDKQGCRLGTLEQCVTTVFGQVTEVHRDTIPDMDGVLGLGIENYPTTFVNRLGGEFFMVHLNRELANGGLLSFDEYDTENCDTTSSGDGINYVDIDQQYNDGFWKFKVDGVECDDYASETGDDFLVFSDTGSPGIALPEHMYDGIMEKIGDEYSYRTWYCDELKGENLPPITLTIGGQKYDIFSEDYIATDIVDTDRCFIDISIFTDKEMKKIGFGGYLGTSFIKSVCEVHDYKNKRIGFVQAKRHSYA